MCCGRSAGRSYTMTTTPLGMKALPQSADDEGLGVLAQSALGGAFLGPML